MKRTQQARTWGIAWVSLGDVLDTEKEMKKKEKQYTVHLTEKQIDVLRLALTVLIRKNLDTVRALKSCPAYQTTVAQCQEEMDTGHAVFSLLCRATHGD